MPTEIDRLLQDLDEATLRDLYSRQGLPVEVIAHRYATTIVQISKLRKRYAIPNRDRTGGPTGPRRPRER